MSKPTLTQALQAAKEAVGSLADGSKTYDAEVAKMIWQILDTVQQLKSESWVPTKQQLASLCNLIHRYERPPDEMSTHNVGLPGVIMVRFNELWIGIEPDGYAHS